jgi:tetratricopeptide (TPR) repeat protein
VPAGADPRLLAHALHNLGIVAMELERYDEALAYHERSRGIREAVQPEGPDLAMSYVNLGDVRHAQQRYPEALVLYRKSLAVAETLGKDHPHVGDALVGIGDTSRRLKALGQAVPALERALAIRTVESRPIERATAEAALAYALWERGGRGDRTRARELATKARQGFVSSRAATKQLAELDAWLRDHAK